MSEAAILSHCSKSIESTVVKLKALFAKTISEMIELVDKEAEHGRVDAAKRVMKICGHGKVFEDSMQVFQQGADQEKKRVTDEWLKDQDIVLSNLHRVMTEEDQRVMKEIDAFNVQDIRVWMAARNMTLEKILREEEKVHQDHVAARRLA